MVALVLFVGRWYPIQVKQKDKVSRPDIDAFEAVMTREDRTKGFFVSFDFTDGALREMILPGALAITVPILVGALIGAEALGGLLVGSIAAGSLLALMMANAGGAWDNAKKYIEAGALGGKGSDAHKAAVVGDTVGDPFKDTSGPSMNILLKLMAIVAVVFGPLFL